MTARVSYTPSQHGADLTQCILDVYDAMPPDDPMRIAIDNMARHVCAVTKPARPGLQGVGERGAIELIGKVLVYMIEHEVNP